MTRTIYCQAGHGFVVDGQMTIGNTIRVTSVIPLDGYEFVRWTDSYCEDQDQDPYNEVRDIEITECGMNIIAEFQESSGRVTYTIAVSVNDSSMGAASIMVNGEDYGSSAEFEENTEITLKAQQKNGYYFIKWGDGDYNKTRTITLDSNKTYKAIFGQNVTYSISLDDNGNLQFSDSNGNIIPYDEIQGNLNQVDVTTWDLTNLNTDYSITYQDRYGHTRNMDADGEYKDYDDDGTGTYVLSTIITKNDNSYTFVNVR